jgi:hypothetical protein
VQRAARAGLDAQALPMPSAVLRPLRLGVLLRHLRAVSESDLNEALQMQRVSGLRLGAELQRTGHVRADQLLRALAAQANVSYFTSFDVARVTRGPLALPVETVRALGLVPFDVDAEQQRIRVICAAPVPRTAVRAMHTLTGWIPEVYLVHDEVWERALRAYGPEPTNAPASEVMTVGGIEAVASFVADQAAADRSVTMRHAQWDRFTWVRVESPTQVANLLVPGTEEGTCQAAPTAH